MDGKKLEVLKLIEEMEDVRSEVSRCYRDADYCARLIDDNTKARSELLEKIKIGEEQLNVLIQKLIDLTV